MKPTKRRMLALFLAGTILFSCAAIADTLIGSGYADAKRALKYTTNAFANNTDSFTMCINTEVKYNGEVLSSKSVTEKYDIKNNKSTSESKVYSVEAENIEQYTYSDSEKVINKLSDSEIYYQHNRSELRKEPLINDPFNEEYAADIEKLADAFVSNMKDFVQIREENGGKLYFTNLDGNQIPAFVSALSGVMMKYSLIDTYRMQKSEINDIKDIYIQEVSGKAFENADGILENGKCCVKMISVEENGTKDIWELCMSVEISDINSTLVKEPEMNGNVEVSEEFVPTQFGVMTERDIGTYRGDIVEQSQKEYVKKGEIQLSITSVSDEQISGHITLVNENLSINTDFTAEFNDIYSEYIAEVKAGEEMRYLSFSNRDDNASITVDANIEKISEEDIIYYDHSDDLYAIELYRVFE